MTPRLFYIDSLNQMRDQIDSTSFSIGFVTDSHFDEGTWRENASRSLRNLNNVLYLQGSLDCVVAGGDNVDSEHRDKSINLRNNQRFVDRLFNSLAIDKFITRGNHDQGSLPFWSANGKVMPAEVINRNEFKASYRTGQKLFGEVRDGDSLYCYKDYPSKKVRVVVVDSIDNPESTNSDGSLKYFDQWDYGYQQTQLKWIAEKALGTCPADYHVVMLSHVPLNKTANSGREQRRNFDCLSTIINAFVNRTSATVKSTLTDFQVDFSVNYSTRTASNFAGFFGGHEHRENIDNMGKFNGITCDNAWPENNEIIGTVQEDSFSIIEIDTTKRQCKTLGFGRSTNRQFNY
ncbi:metallophosphoesterase [Enterococcus devriesei]|uniref:metallophosphoesterase family protein n=1 Tax=Enterococcus devriesei TaxID=319970 RepID=UPI0028E95B87|nr:metallophosphoesterase [Enterococcus devriesei]